METLKVLKRLEAISSLDSQTVLPVIIKAGEEYGELCAAVLKKQNCSNVSQSADDNDLEEAIDTIMCLLDYLLKSGYTFVQMNEMMNFKLTKWANKVTPTDL